GDHGVDGGAGLLGSMIDIREAVCGGRQVIAKKGESSGVRLGPEGGSVIAVGLKDDDRTRVLVVGQLTKRREQCGELETTSVVVFLKHALPNLVECGE